MGTRTNTEEAAIAVQRALLQCVGPGAAEQLALAQARLAWQETVGEAGLAPAGMWSRLTAVKNGVATIVASEPMLAAELKLRADHLVGAVNARQRGRPGALYELRGLTVSIRPGDAGPEPGEQPG
jgi:predicted nucleic acid-binding Zn ribbon protein